MGTPPLFPWQRWLRLGLATAVVTFLVAFAMLPPSLSRMLPGCTFKSLTGLPCATCGGTRSARALLHGDLDRALYLNAISLPAIGLLLVGALVLLLEAARGRPLTDWPRLGRPIRPWLPLLIVLLLLWWVPHIIGALRKPKLELIDLRNPVAAYLYHKLHETPAAP